MQTGRPCPIVAQGRCTIGAMDATIGLDALDRRILRALQEDGRLSYEALAGRVGLSPSAALRRFIGETLLVHPSVQDCRTSFVLDRVKAATAVPL